MKLVAWFNEVGKDDVGLVGGKGANLGELTRAGIPVPAGFVVTSDVYFDFVERADLRDHILPFLKGLNVEDNAALQRASSGIKSLITAATMPREAAEEIARCYREMGGGAVAVRSSATAEDLAEASFAGQQSTYLNIEGEDSVIKAVQECWASLFEARAIFYRASAGFDHLKVGIAVVVQHMVQSERSGVMFTVDPVTNAADRIVIEAIYGLGEAIVSGAVTPDMYVSDKATLQLIDSSIATQDRQLIRNPAAGRDEDPNHWVEVTAAERNQPKLTDHETREIARIGKQVEQHYGRPQDIEWALEGGSFYIVQSRPVTTGQAAPGTDEDAEMGVETAPVLIEGAPASPGVACGSVKIVRGPEDIDLVEAGDVLVAAMTTPDYVPAMKRAAGIITDEGGRLCHAAIVSRELGVPCVVGTGTATGTLRTAQMVTVDGSRGRVYEGRPRSGSRGPMTGSAGAPRRPRSRPAPAST